MSLLQEALRRAQQKERAAPFPLPASLPGRPAGPWGPSVWRRRLIVVAACVAILLLAGGALLLRPWNGGAGRRAPFSSRGAIATDAGSKGPVKAEGASLSSAAAAPPAQPDESLRTLAFSSPPPPLSSSASRDVRSGSKAAGEIAGGAEKVRGAEASDGRSEKASRPLGFPPPQGASPAVAPAPVAPVSLASQGSVAAGAAIATWFNEGVAALARGDWEKAERRFRDVLAADPSVVEAWNNLGVTLSRRGKSVEASAAFREAALRDPAYAPALLNAGLLLLGEIGKEAEAEALFSRAAAADPGSVAALVDLAIARARLGRLGEAEGTLLAALRRFPGDPDVLYHLGTVYERTGERQKAAAAYRNFLAASAGSRPALEKPVRERLAVWSDRNARSGAALDAQGPGGQNGKKTEVPVGRPETGN